SPFPVTVFGGCHHAVECGQGFLVLEPRFSPPARRVDRFGILDHQALVRSSACRIEQLINVLPVTNLTLIRETNLRRSNDPSKSRQSIAQWQFEKRFPIEVEKIEGEEGNRRIVEKCLADLPAAEAGLDDGEGEN